MIIKYNVHLEKGYDEMMFRFTDRHTALDFMALAVLNYVRDGDYKSQDIKCWIDIETAEGDDDGKENV